MQAGTNPTAALDALLPEPLPVEGTVEAVRPITLAMFAQLERIKSPMLFGGEDVDTLALLPSLFLLCRGPSAAWGGRLLERSVEWADTLLPDALPRIREAARRQIAVVLDVIPESKKNGIAGQTAGSSPSASGLAGLTDGGLTTPSTPSPPPPSSPSSANSAPPKETTA